MRKDTKGGMVRCSERAATGAGKAASSLAEAVSRADAQQRFFAAADWEDPIFSAQGDQTIKLKTVTFACSAMSRALRLF